MKLHHVLPLALSALTLLSFASQEGSQRTRRTARGIPQTTKQESTTGDLTGADQGTRDFPGARRDDAIDVFGRRRDSAETKTPQELLMGGWQLQSMKLRKAPTSGRGVGGLLVVSENFLSLELHGSGDPTSRLNGLAFHMSLGGEYVLDPNGRLTLRTMIGSYQDEDSDGLAWQQAGMQREFKAVFTERQLMLTWGGNANQLIFNRRAPSMTGRTDIFGRKVEPSADGPSLGTDIFGRSVPDSGASTDIFGRKIPGSTDGTGGDRR